MHRQNDSYLSGAKMWKKNKSVATRSPASVPWFHAHLVAGSHRSCSYGHFNRGRESIMVINSVCFLLGVPHGFRQTEKRRMYTETNFSNGDQNPSSASTVSSKIGCKRSRTEAMEVETSRNHIAVNGVDWNRTLPKDETWWNPGLRIWWFRCFLT